MAEIESLLYIVDDDEKKLKKIIRLFGCDNEEDMDEVAQSLFNVDDAFKKHLTPGMFISNYYDLVPDDFEFDDGYIQAEFFRSSNGEEIINGWVQFLTDISPTSIIHGWGKYDDDPYEFWYKGKAGKVKREDSEPLRSDKSDKKIIDKVYKWWHEDMPSGIKVGILGSRLRRPAKKKSNKKVATKKAKKKYKNIFEAYTYNVQDYDYLSEKITNRNLYQEDGFHLSLFKYALINQDRTLSQLLLDKGFDIQSDYGKNLLRWMADFHDYRAKDLHHSVQYLVEIGVDINLQSEKYLTTALMRAVNNHKLYVVQNLIECGADVTLLDYQGANALFHMQSKHHQDEILDALIDGGIDIHHQDMHKQTALFFSVRWQLESVTRRLIEMGLDINQQNVVGCTPLHGAQWTHHMPVAKVSIELGADPFVANDKGVKPIDNMYLFEMIKNEKLIELPDEY
jgi:ankyrin repeat protein